MYKTPLRNGTTKVNYACAKQINVEKYKRCFVEILPVIVCINFSIMLRDFPDVHANDLIIYKT